MREMLSRNYRCLYLNSEPMLRAMQAYLSRAGVNFDAESRRASLVLSLDRDHLISGRFDLDSMIEGLSFALDQALADGFEGLFATGDMSWEFGPNADFSQLMEYEWKLERFLEAHPQLSAVCQYHANRLPRGVMRQGLVTHQRIYVNDELSLPNPNFAPSPFWLDARLQPHVM